MINVLAVFVGGGLGSLCRYGLGLLLPSNNFPVGTLIANVLACFMLGFLTGYIFKNNISDGWKFLVGTGFCGGFSTFSTFSKEIVTLGQNQLHLTAVLYLVISLIVGVLAVYFGILLGNFKN